MILYLYFMTIKPYPIDTKDKTHKKGHFLMIIIIKQKFGASNNIFDISI